MSSGEEIIEVTISKDGGKIKLNAEGFSGKACSTTLNELAKALGSMADFTKKSEFYNNEELQEVTVNPIK